MSRRVYFVSTTRVFVASIAGSGPRARVKADGNAEAAAVREKRVSWRVSRGQKVV